MQDINNCIKETDTDNVILNKLKQLGTKLTGQENVQGETVAEVLDFINANYSGGGSVNALYFDSDDTYVYKDKNLNTKVNKEELINLFKSGCTLYDSFDECYFQPINLRIYDNYAKIILVQLNSAGGTNWSSYYSSEYK